MRLQLNAQPGTQLDVHFTALNVCLQSLGHLQIDLPLCRLFPANLNDSLVIQIR